MSAPARTTGGNCRYSDADLARIERIAELTDIGIPLAGVRHILDLERRIAELSRHRTPSTASMTRCEAQLPARYRRQRVASATAR